MSPPADETPANLTSAVATIGVDVGGSKISAGVVDAAGCVVARTERATPDRRAPASAAEDAIVDAVVELRGTVDVAAVGVGAAGFVDAQRRRVRFAPHLSWREEPLAQRLQDRLGLPVQVDNDANAALWAEHRIGAARSAADVVLITLGTGIGGALLIGGAPYRGYNGMAGEFGHTQVFPGTDPASRPCECGRKGCWEQYCSGKALIRYAESAGSSLRGRELTEAAHTGDPAALGAYAEIGSWLGLGIANVVAAFDPELVVVGGGVSAAGELLLEPARATLRAALVGRGHRHEPRVVPTQLGPDAGLVGAALLAREPG